MAISGMQKMFNKVVRHMRKQNSRSIYSLGCAYRGQNGKRCAIGCLIPNHLYKDCMEGESAKGIIENFPDLANHFEKLYGFDKGSHNQVDFLSAMQSAHDDLRDDYSEGVMRTQIENKFSRVAQNFDLRMPK